MTRITYDPVANAAHIYVKDRIESGELVRTRPCKLDLDAASAILGFDSEGMLILIEILGARKLLSPEILKEAEPH
jgi:uncharacterized protein YuzE